MMIVNETAKLGVEPLGECGLGSRKRILINDAGSLLGVTQQPKTRRRAALNIHKDEIGAVRRYRSKQQPRDYNIPVTAFGLVGCGRFHAAGRRLRR